MLKVEGEKDSEYKKNTLRLILDLNKGKKKIETLQTELKSSELQREVLEQERKAQGEKNREKEQRIQQLEKQLKDSQEVNKSNDETNYVYGKILEVCIISTVIEIIRSFEIPIGKGNV